MDVIERLTLEAAQADTMLACEHRHRYQFAAGLCAGQRVLDLCCGSGYGTAIVAARAREVVGVDNDAATVDTARVTVGRELANLSFELADAIAFLRGEIAGRFDVVTCFEGLEHLEDLGSALALLREHCQRGLRLIASVPNGKLFAEQNPFHVTEFGYDEAVEAFAPFPSTVMVPQFLAEGSLICPPDAREAEVTVTLDDRDEPEYASHFVFCVNFDADAVQRVHHGRIQLNTAPVFNRWAEDLKRGAWALRRENARLARDRLGKGGSAAAAALAGLADREAEVAGLRERLRTAEARVRELDAALAGLDSPPEMPPDFGEAVAAAPAGGEAIDAKPLAISPGEDPNTWEHRHRRAAEYLVPWIEQSVPLAGKTVLEYGCGNAPVSCAVAERARRVIGFDIDPGWIELAQQEVRRHGIRNVELEQHDVDVIFDAVRRRRGTIDVFLLYAVLEHLSVPERLAVLRLARDVVKPDGVIVVCETPNRLIYTDHHTAQMPFFHLLPDELAVDYYPRSARRDFKDAIDAAAQRGRGAALEAIVRWGRGVSFHEFELVFGERLDQHVIASNYDPLLFGERPIQADEIMLARYLQRWRPDLAPAWSRCWLDLILSPQPVARRAPFLRPWTAETVESSGVGWTRAETIRLRGAGATLLVTLPHPTERLVVGSTTQDGRQLVLYVRPDGAASPLAAAVQADVGDTAFASFTLPAPATEIAVGASDECELNFVGYED
ncbi:MAG: class I SAM-dependent methyltransferase [Solirubrobacteraceae bacterium]